ncbi:LysR family transcriptional regulator [Micromonospora sp. HM5-17]|uniref:LysR family transcriptional regulator n=1 Tax=Micromonospora sp. HM5-17 TaxID=2487710 RepID=UPI000F49AE91|nr:LysR family transcriptional regulator [Micromonospora sp. HM5-17]ROT32617.1 LysR family transcriptional regulator [Micromonospora sp. HM5-17]
MELRHLEVFLAIAEEGTLTAAGERLHLVQSGVSSTLRALEADLDATLFTRTARRAVLTDAGRALLPEARATLAAAAAARQAVRETQAGLRGPLAVGTMTTMQLVDLPRLLARFQSRHPRVTVSMRAFPDGSAGLVRALTEGELDVAFVSVNGPPPPGVTVRLLAEVPLRLILPPEHPLADAPEVSLAEVAGDRWIDSPLGFGNRAVVDEAFARASLRRSITLEIADVTSIPAYVQAGLGVALVPEFIPLEGTGLRPQRLRGVDLRWSMSLATPGGRVRRRVVATFVAAVEQELGLDREPGTEAV